MDHNISAIQSGGQVLVIVDGKHYRRSGPEADSIYDKALDAQANPTDNNVDNLLEALDPHSEVVKEGVLERDDMGSYTLPGTSTALPKSMVKHIIRLQDSDAPTQPLKKFWKQALMNPNEQARNDMFEYCRDYGITITSEGYMVLYKAVNKNPASKIDDELVDFIGTKYLRIKRQSSDPSNHHVLQDQNGEYHLVRKDVLSSLQITDLDEPIPPEVITPKGEGKDPFDDLLEFALDAGIITPDHDDFMNLPSIGDYDSRTVNLANLNDGKVHWKVYNHIREIVDQFISEDYYVEHGTLSELYEHAQESHDGQFEPSSIAKNKGGKYGMSINLGEPVPMPREKCDPSIHQSCSKGLHVGSYDYVSSFGSSRDTILACLVSPRDIVALPKTDQSKLRTCLYLPYAIMERDDNGDWEEIEDTHIDIDYMEKESDMEKLLNDLESQNDLSEVQEDRKKVIEDRLKEIK